MEKIKSNIFNITRHGIIEFLLLITLISIGFIIANYFNFLLFHIAVELFSVVISFTTFLIAWNTRKISEKNYFLFLGIAYLFVGILDLTHTMAYKGMGIFKDYGANLSIQLWIGARYLESISLAIAPIFFKKRLRVETAFVVYFLICTMIFLSIFVWPIFPDCYVEGKGLTFFKKVSEYIICFILVGGGIVLHKNQQYLNKYTFKLIMFAIFTTMCAEIAFTFYVSVYGLSNVIGHFFKIISFYFIYKAVIVNTLTNPYNTLFKDLFETKEKFHHLAETEALERTRLAETNEELKRLRDSYELAMSLVPTWCWELDLKNLKFNTIFTTLSLGKEDFLTLDDLLNFLFSPEKKDIHDLIKEVIEGKRWKFEGVRLFKFKDGKNLWIKVNAKAIPHDKGRPERVIGICYDITWFIETQNRLEEESVLNKTLTELAEEIISTDSISKISELVLEAALYFTNSPHGFAGYIDPTTGDLINPCISKNDWKDWEVPNKKLIFSCNANLIGWLSKKVQPILVNMPEQDFRFAGTPLAHMRIRRFLSVPAIKNNSVIGHITVANVPFDYTDKHLKIMEQIANLYALGIERILKENNLQKALLAVQEATQLKHDFLLSISHELRTPLNAILGFAQLLESQIDRLSQDKIAKYISHILQAGRNLTSMIEDVLAVCSAENITSSFNKKLCSVEQLINEFKQMAVSMASQKQIHLEIKSDPNINNLQIRTDPYMLKIAVRHLVDNAIKFTPNGGKVSLNFYLTDTDFVFSVKDTGIGIEPKDQQRIFEDFVQLKSSLNDKTPGLGLGLGVVKRIAIILKGNIEVKSEGQGKGSEFILELPIAQKTSSEKNKI